MSNWTATNELRWFKLPPESGVNAYEGFWTYPYVLKQKWETIVQVPSGNFEIVSEWRDIPLVEEE